MFVEEYHKSKGGRAFYTAYFRFGSVLVSVSGIKANDKEEAKELAKKFLKKAMEE
jgi:hypothetical protein